MALVNPDFAEELKPYGVDTALECFNCGTCAAICPLIYEHFPRKMIRYVQVGAKEKILQNGPGTLAVSALRPVHPDLSPPGQPRRTHPGAAPLRGGALKEGVRMFNPRDIIDLIAANVRRSRNPFGAPASRLNTWWRQAGGFTRRPGDALLFTGLMYQAIPYIEATTRYLERLEGSRWADYLRLPPAAISPAPWRAGGYPS